MSVFNRRNAALGWATWSVGKQAMKRKAKPPASKRKKGVIAGILAGAVGLALFWRHKGGDDDLPPTE